MLTDTEIEAVLEKADQLASWASDIKDYALQRAISGKQWNGYKVVEGRSNRKYTDAAKVIEKVKAYGKNPYNEPELLGVTAMTKLLGGKKKFDELLGDYTYKPPGKPALVPISDKVLIINVNMLEESTLCTVNNIRRKNKWQTKEKQK